MRMPHKEVYFGDLIREMILEDANILTLYKYRSYTKDHILSELDGNFWISKRELLNDPFDLARVAPFTNTASLAMKLMPFFRTIPDFKIVSNDVERALEADPATYLHTFYRHFRSDEKARDIVEMLFKKNNSFPWIHNFIKRVQERVVDELNGTSVFSLTEDSASELMWAHYGGNYQGYCMGYSYPDPKHSKAIFHQIGLNRVVYIQDNGEPFSIEDVITYPILLFLCGGFKPEKWNYEKEWRVTFPTAFVNGPGFLVESKCLPISEIIIGYKMPKDNQKFLIQEALKRGISNISVIEPDYRTNQLKKSKI